MTKKPHGHGRVTRLWFALETWVRWTAGVVGALAVLVTTGYTLDGRYAKDVELVQLSQQVQRGQLRADYQRLRYEETYLRSIPERERRQPTEWERARLQEVQEQIEEVRRDLERLGGRP